MEKKVVLPGDYLAGCEEYVAGKNTYTKDDNIYANITGIVETSGRQIEVKGKKSIANVSLGQTLLGQVIAITESKAVLACMPESEGENRYSEDLFGVLPVSAAGRGYVRSIRDSIRTGDIVRAKVTSPPPSLELTISYPEYGVIKAFCIKCRNEMVLKTGKLMCKKCSHIEIRKMAIPLENKSGVL